MKRGRRLRALAVSGALLALPSAAAAQLAQQGGLTERVRLQGGYTRQFGQPPDDDGWGGVVPEISYLFLEPRTQLRLTYSLTIAVHSAFPTDVANRLSLASVFDLSERTTLLLSADAVETTVLNELIAHPAGETALGTVPVTSTRLLTAHAAEGTSWEASPVVRLGQTIDGYFATSLDSTPLANSLVSARFGADRSWKNDALGVDLSGAYARNHLPPIPDQQIMDVGVAPRWRHDINRALTASVSAGASFIFSPDPGTKQLLKPFLQATMLYAWQDATVDLTYLTGVQPNLLTAQLLDADRVALHAGVPLSVRHRVVAGASIGYLHARVVNLVRDAPTPPNFDAILGDADLGWSPAERVQLFARYQFLDQITQGGDAATTSAPSLLRHAIIAGVVLTAQPDDLRVRTRFPQRVDRGDPP